MPRAGSCGNGIIGMGGHSGNPKILGRVFKISGFKNYYPKFVWNNENLTFRVPENSGLGSGSGKPELPNFQQIQSKKIFKIRKGKPKFPMNYSKM